MRKKSYDIFKRIMDISISLLAIIVFSPVFITIIIIIKLKNEGPVIFKQERVGRYGKIFIIYKFRSMSINAPNLAARKINKEEYISRFGRFIRRTSIDELPQLFNILKGDMSFVGPRPFIPSEGQILEDRNSLGIDKLLPGLTGWAQIKARQTEDQNFKLSLDKHYMENKSLWIDTKIIFFTVFNNKGH